LPPFQNKMAEGTNALYSNLAKIKQTLWGVGMPEDEGTKINRRLVQDIIARANHARRLDLNERNAIN
jgi:hypothetical protein